MNIEYVENKHSNDKGLFIREEVTWICEQVMNGLYYDRGLQAITKLYHSINENRT